MQIYAFIIALFYLDGVHPTSSIEIKESITITLPDKSTSVVIKKCLKIDDLLIFMDNRSQIYSYTFSKQYERFERKIFSIPLDDEALDIAVRGNDIAVLLRNHIKCIAVGHGFTGIKHDITLDIQNRRQYGLAFLRNVFYVAQQNQNAVVITVFNSNGHSTELLEVCPLRSNNIEVQLTVKGNIYCSIFDPTREEMERSTVYCFDISTRNILWQFSDSCLGRLYGCTTDYCRNVYVTNGNNLTVISSTGRNFKTLLNDVPQSSDVFFDDSDRYLVVCSENGTIQLLRLEIVHV